MVMGDRVLAMAPLDLHLVDVVTGQLKWSLPRDTFGAPSNAGFSTILVGDFTGDEVDDIYIADGGCADVGTGIGAVINLANGIEPNDTILLNNERDGGRCGRWHTAMDVDSDGRQDIIITDRRGLNAFDTLTGRKTVCGTMENAPPAARSSPGRPRRGTKLVCLQGSHRRTPRSPPRSRERLRQSIDFKRPGQAQL